MYADSQMPERLDEARIAVCVEIFSLLADATRLRIVLALRDGEESVGAIAEEVGKSQAAVSQHLAKMRMSRMVTTRQDGNRIYYRLANDHALELIQVAVHQSEHALGDPLSHRHREG
ncbi:MAG: ArsR/SmtB family transcription factor [Nocardioides sp.]|uniref:ArsR/SmtB family transcription factor n=1 Tax=Nocardioides sp. TaxID=35761 RepID=UPI003F04E15F